MNQLPPTNFKTPELHRVQRYRVIHEAPHTLYSPQEGDPQLSIHAVSSNASSDEKPKQRKTLVEFSPQVETDLLSVPLKRGTQAAKQERDSPVALEVEECTPSMIVVTDCDDPNPNPNPNHNPHPNPNPNPNPNVARCSQGVKRCHHLLPCNADKKCSKLFPGADPPAIVGAPLLLQRTLGILHKVPLCAQYQK